MPDQYSAKKITELTTKTVSDDTDLYVLGNEGTATMRKITFATIAAAVRDKLTTLTFSSLNTTNKTLPGAVNELNSNKTVYINSSTYDDFYSKINALPGGSMFVFSIPGAVASIITGGAVTVTLKGLGSYMDTSQKYVDFLGYEGTNKTGRIFRSKLNSDSSAVTVQTINEYGLDNLVKSVSYSYSGSFAANSDTHISRSAIGYTAYAGYTTVGFVSFATTNTYLVTVRLAPESTAQFVSVRNLSSSTISNATITVTVLYIKTTAI